MHGAGARDVPDKLAAAQGCGSPGAGGLCWGSPWAQSPGLEGAQPIGVTGSALAVQGGVHRLCLPGVPVAATVPLALLGLWGTEALEVQCPLSVSAKSPLAPRALQGQKESPSSAKAPAAEETPQMLFAPSLGDGFGDFLVSLGILCTFPEAKEQRARGRGLGLPARVCTRG